MWYKNLGKSRVGRQADRQTDSCMPRGKNRNILETTNPIKSKFDDQA